MLTASVLDPLSFINFSGSASVGSHSRFREIPSEDEMICNSDKVRARVHPPEYPGFIPPNASIHMKLLAMLHSEGLGKVDRTSGHDIVLYQWVHDEISRLLENEDAASDLPAVGERDYAPSGERQQFVDLKPNPAHSVFPVSVALLLKKQQQLVQRLQADGDRNSIWPNAIQFYQPFQLFADDPIAHYDEKVLQSSRDRYFDVGLFGQCANGLTIILLALAKASKSFKTQKKGASAAASSSSSRTQRNEEPSGAEKLKTVLFHYITLICLQYWTLVHRRWMELDPSTRKDSAKYLPECLFIFHHSTDWTQNCKDFKRDRKGKARKKNADEHFSGRQIINAATLQEAAGETAFIRFVEGVFDYVINRMEELEDGADEDIAAACKKLMLSRSAVSKHCSTISTNHTQFFTCSRMKMHIVQGLVETINAGVHSDTIGQSLGFLETKWFAKNKDQLKMYIPKAANEAATAGVNRYNNPYFWSHLTFLPTQGIVTAEITLTKGDKPESSAAHQACALRRLLFTSNNSDSATIMKSLASLGDLAFESIVGDDVIVSSKDFIEQFVCTKKFTSMAVLHSQRADQQLYLPAVVNPATLRYAVQFEDEVGRAYVPSLSRDLASFPVSDENDILSMSRSYWLACSHSKKTIIADQATLLQMRVLQNNPANLCTRFASSRLTHSAFPVLKDLGGLSHTFTKLCPADPLCNLVVVDSFLKLSDGERQQLRFIVNGTETFRALDMWKLLLKIATSDQEAISSYLFHAHRSEKRAIVKVEHAVAAPIADPIEYTNAWALDRLEQLQSLWEKAKQADLVKFRRVWGATIPPPEAKRKSEATLDFVANPHWSAQEKFLEVIRESWNHCDRPTVSAHSLTRLISEMMAVDLDQFQITLFESHAQDGGVRLNPEKLQMLISGAVISQLGNTGPTPLHSLTSIVDEGREKLKEHEIVFTGRSQSMLGKKFAEFFKTRRYATASCNIEVAFFLWYYFTVFIRPFADNLPRLFPVSSVIKQKRTTSTPARKWIEALVPSDATPHLTSLMFKISADICKAEIQRELETSLDRGTKLSSHALAMLTAMQTVIQAQDLTDPTRPEDSKLNSVQQSAAMLLQSAAVSSGASSSSRSLTAAAQVAVPGQRGLAGMTCIQAIEARGTNAIIQGLKVFKTVQASTVEKLFDELSSLISIEHDPIDNIASILRTVQGTLISQGPSTADLFTSFRKCVDGWERSESQLLRACANRLKQLIRRF